MPHLWAQTLLRTLLLAAPLCAAWPAHAADAAAQRRVGSDTFIFGGTLRIEQALPGDLIAAAGTLDVEAPVAGDALLAGGTLRLGGAVGQSVFAAAGRLNIDAAVARNLRVAGGQVDLSPAASVGGNVSVGGGQVSLRGPIKGSLTVAGGSVLLDGPVDGDVMASAGQLTLGPKARVAGRLNYRSRDEVQRDPAAQVLGAIERLPLPAGAMMDDAQHPASGAMRRAEQGDWDGHASWGGPSWLWTLGLMLVAALMVYQAPDAVRRITQSLSQHPGRDLLWGLVVLVCVPVAALMMVFTIIGIPLALLVLLLYGALLLLAYVTTGVALGQWVLGRFKADALASTAWRIGAAVAAVWLLAVLGSLPWVGGAVSMLALLTGMGALILIVSGRLEPAPSP